jgi:hypothetical protein
MYLLARHIKTELGSEVPQLGFPRIHILMLDTVSFVALVGRRDSKVKGCSELRNENPPVLFNDERFLFYELFFYGFQCDLPGWRVVKI